MKAGRVVVIVLLGVMLALAAWLLMGAPSSVTLTRDDLQREVEKRFPIEKSEILVTVRLSEPRVLLKPDSDRIGLGVTITVSAPIIQSLKGKGELDGELRFDSESRELYLDSPDLKITEASGISDKDLRAAEELIGPLLRNVLSRIPIYRLKDTDLRQPVINASVKEIQVNAGTVTLRFAR